MAPLNNIDTLSQIAGRFVEHVVDGGSESFQKSTEQFDPDQLDQVDLLALAEKVIELLRRDLLLERERR